jgi:biopolymer transport protein ExbB/biopolymer transport protein TolQ
MLGTVIGIVDGAFRGCVASRAACQAAQANGVSEALMSTGLGLLVAVPALWSFNYFTERLEHLDLEVQNSSMELTTYLALRISRLRMASHTPPP